MAVTSLPAFKIPGYLSPVSSSSLRQSTVTDIVFMHRDAKNNYDFGFAIGWCLESVNLQFDEITIPDTAARSEGLSVFKISGQLHLLQNSAPAINQISLHGGRLFEMHILYGDEFGTVESIPPKVGNTDLIGLDAAALARYPAAVLFLNLPGTFQDLGVKFRIATFRGGKNLAPTIDITGLTFGSGLWSIGNHASPSAFYSHFPTLDRWLTPPPISTGGSNTNIGI